MESDSMTNRLVDTHPQSVGFIEFMDLISSAMRTSWGEDMPNFTMNAPKLSSSKNVELPAIVYSLEELQPGQVGNKSTREIKPRIREFTQEESDMTGESIQVKYTGQVQDGKVSFTIYGQSNQEVINWTSLFRQLMKEYLHYFLDKGILNIYWLSETDDVSGLAKDNYYVGRKLNYLVRFEEVNRIELRSIEQIDLAIRLARNQLELEGLLPSRQVARFTLKDES